MMDDIAMIDSPYEEDSHGYSRNSDARPPSARELDRLQYHIDLQDIGERLQNAANAAFPNDQRMKYSNVHVLLLSWEEEDPQLPVSLEIEELRQIFRTMYYFNVEVWKIPPENSHLKLNRRILDFIELGNDSQDELKIVYYGGHGMLAKNRRPCWTSHPTRRSPSREIVKWSGIQNALEEARSDVLLLLDCCASGLANTDDGRGTTELIAACAFNDIANPVGPDSFTRALIIELKALRFAPAFTVGLLYNRILCRIQTFMPIGREMQKSPLHVVLSQDPRLPSSIQISAIRVLKETVADQLAPGGPNLKAQNTVQYTEKSAPSRERWSSSSSAASLDDDSLELPLSSSPNSSLFSGVQKLPRIALTINLRESLEASQLSEDLLAEWLRMIPLLINNVKVEAGFASFSTVLVISMPIAIWCYLSPHSAIRTFGLLKSSNLVGLPLPSLVTSLKDKPITPVKSSLNHMSSSPPNQDMESPLIKTESGIAKVGLQMEKMEAMHKNDSDLTGTHLTSKDSNKLAAIANTYGSSTVFPASQDSLNSRYPARRISYHFNAAHYSMPLQYREHEDGVSYTSHDSAYYSTSPTKFTYQISPNPIYYETAKLNERSNSKGDQRSRTTFSNLGWTSSANSLDLYDFIVPRFWEPYFKLAQASQDMLNIPDKVFLDTPKNDTKDEFPCLYPGEYQCPSFKRRTDLDRHYRNAHGGSRPRGKFLCDYDTCKRRAFLGKAYLRNHLCNYHKEVVGSLKKETNETIENSSKERLIHYENLTLELNEVTGWWRCPKCLCRVQIAESGFNCQDCKFPGDTESRDHILNLG